MKKCPNCQKTYEDNLKYCQSDGTPLVVVAEEKPSEDPYKTMVASDLKLPVEQPVEEKTPQPVDSEPADGVDPVSDPGGSGVADAVDADAGVADAVDADVGVADAVDAVDADAGVADAVDSGSVEDVLEIPDESEPFDPLKTVVAGSSETANNIKVADVPETAAPEETIPEDKIAAEEHPVAEEEVVGGDASMDDAETAEELPVAEEELDSEAATIIVPDIPQVTPDIPKFSEPEIAAPDLDAPDSGSGLFGEKRSKSEEAESKSSVPIPSPFDESMPPGMAIPEDPPFGETAGKGSPAPSSPFAEQPAETSGMGGDIASASAQVPEVSGSEPFGSNQILASGDGSADGVEGDNKTLSIVSLVFGILGVLCCAGGILFGPVALITGYMAKNKITEDPSVYGGATFANIGMILGIVGVVLSIAVIALNLLSVFSSF